jgi:excinuclease ABC subunit A
MEDQIIVKGARTHNLKNITVAMPRNKMVVFTGLSGSGKSSLAFDTIFAEGQRRYVESLSAYARQFLHQFQKPDVDEIVGLSPAISIDQKSRSSNPRSTVATVTEIYDYLRVLYARIGKPHCLICDREIRKLSVEEMLGFIYEEMEKVKNYKNEEANTKPSLRVRRGGRGNPRIKKGVLLRQLADQNDENQTIKIYAPVVRGRKGEYYQLLYDALSKGFSQARIDGKPHSLRDQIILTKHKKHSIDLLVDELKVADFFGVFPNDAKERLTEAVERALAEAEGLITIVIGDDWRKASPPHMERVLSSKFSCPYDGFSYPEVEPRLFSFNSPYGACEVCNGLGTKHLFGDEVCPACKGSRLREEALHIYVGGKNIVEYTTTTVAEAAKFLLLVDLTERERTIAAVVLREVGSRLQFLLNVGLN